MAMIVAIVMVKGKWAREMLTGSERLAVICEYWLVVVSGTSSG